MTKEDEPKKEVAVNMSSKTNGLQNRVVEMQRMAMAAQQLAEDLKTVDCRLEITMGDTRAAMLFSAMLGLEDEEGEARSVNESDGKDLPIELDRLTLPRIRMGAIREGQKAPLLAEIDSQEFLAGYRKAGRLKRFVIPELIIRFCLGNPGEIFDSVDMVELFMALGAFERKESQQAFDAYRSVLARTLRKLHACNFLKKVREGTGRYSPLYAMNPDFDPEEPFIRRHFFDKIHPQFYKKTRKPTRRFT